MNALLERLGDEMLVELRAIRAVGEQLVVLLASDERRCAGGQSGVSPHAMAAVLRDIAAVIGDATFTVKSLLEVARVREEKVLLQAIESLARGAEPRLWGRRLGAALSAVQGRDLEGLRVERSAGYSDRDGATWVLRVCESRDSPTITTVEGGPVGADHRFHKLR